MKKHNALVLFFFESRHDMIYTTKFNTLSDRLSVDISFMHFVNDDDVQEELMRLKEENATISSGEFNNKTQDVVFNENVDVSSKNT